jgi:hypothetical protein
LTEDERIVNQRWEEIDRLYQGQILRETVDPRIVEGLRTDDQVRV